MQIHAMQDYVVTVKLIDGIFIVLDICYPLLLTMGYVSFVNGFAVSEVALDWRELVVQQRTAGCAVRPKLHYTDTGYADMLYNTTNGHHQRTSSQQF